MTLLDEPVEVHTGRGEPSYAGYKIDGCRCEGCRAAEKAYRRALQQDPAPRLVGAARARQHVQMLTAKGVGLKTIAARAGVSYNAICKLMYGKAGGSPSKRIRPETESAILSVSSADAAPGASIDASSTWETIEVLQRRGWTKTAIAHAIGQAGALQLGREQVSKRNADAIRELLDRPVPPRRSRWGTHEAEVDGGEESVAPAYPMDLLRLAGEGATEWMASAACRLPNVPTRLFFPGVGDVVTVAAAKAVCRSCPVSSQCVEYAMRNDEDGIWGGMGQDERRKLRRRLRRRAR